VPLSTSLVILSVAPVLSETEGKDLIATTFKVRSLQAAMRSFAYGAVNRALLRTTERFAVANLIDR